MGWVELKFERLLNFFIGVGKLVMEIETVVAQYGSFEKGRSAIW